MEVTLAATTGRPHGSSASRRLRREGMVPAVVYANDLEPIPVAVNHRELSAALRTEAGSNVIVSLDVEGGETYTTLVREIKRHAYKPRIDHVDFVRISLTDTVSAEVSIDFVGEPVGVRNNGGIVETMNTSVSIEALPTAIPSSLECNIEDLDIGDTITVESLTAPEGVEIMSEMDMPLASVSLPAAVRAEDERRRRGRRGRRGRRRRRGRRSWRRVFGLRIADRHARYRRALEPRG